jgi:DNA-directed RNA polymerase subunit D
MDLKVDVLGLSDEVIRFVVEECDVALANALRRTMIAEVPTMAIDDIFYFDNSSVVPDEVLAHRIGMVPLKTDLEHYVLPERCDCGAELGCPKCRVALTLDIKAGAGNRVVYSGDIVSADPGTTPVSQYIPLAKLAPGQAIRFEAYAQLGRGKINSKWSPVSMAIYQNVAEITSTDKALIKACATECPRAVIPVSATKIRVVDVQSFNRTDSCKQLLGEGSLREHMKENEFAFTVESTGALKPERIVAEAVKILEEKLVELTKKLDGGEVHEEILDFEAPQEVGRKLYAVGTGDFDEEEEGEGEEEGGPPFEEP